MSEVQTIDLMFQDTPGVIASYVFDTGDGLAVVDTGPYRVVEGALATNVPGRRGAPTLVTLRRVGEEWRIAAVQASGDAPRS